MIRACLTESCRNSRVEAQESTEGPGVQGAPMSEGPSKLPLLLCLGVHFGMGSRVLPALVTREVPV